MAASPKVSLRPAALMSLAVGSGDLPVPSFVTRPAKLDFAANPNHYRINGNGKVKKAKLRQGPRVDLSPRLELALSVECETSLEHEE